VSPRIGCLTILLSITVLAGCSSPSQSPSPAAADTPDLSATLTSPVDIVLKWKADDPDAAGRTIEYATTPDEPYTILQFLPPGQTTYKHPDLMPQTPFYYRLRPFYGPATPEIEVDLPPGVYDEKAQADNHTWAQPVARPEGSVAKQAIRGTGRPGAGAPTDFKATVMDPNGIKFTWTDHANDEDGYLLESKPRGSSVYNEVAVLDPNVNSVGLVTLPSEKEATYRIRAFYYGPASNIAHQTTGDTPPGA
jgi:hypothetical protein